MVDSAVIFEKHVTSYLRLRDTIEGKLALLATCEQAERPDHDYMRALGSRIRRLKTQYSAMRPVAGE